MKDENGALQVGASYGIEEFILRESTVDVMRYVKDKLGRNLGFEILKSFEPTVRDRVDVPVRELEIRLVVMSPSDYQELSEKAWKYDELQ